MRVIFSRKGFDSGSGGFPSPIISGAPISLPIPTRRHSPDTYASLGLGALVERVSRGKIARDRYCHHDPQYADGRWAFGQTGGANTHLLKQGVAIGDVFLFFGLFADDRGRDRHHRIFGYMRIDQVHVIGADPTGASIMGFERHPHLVGDWNDNNTIYVGAGARASSAPPILRLTSPGGATSRWRVPPWLQDTGLTWHGDPTRWSVAGELQTVGRGQEFVTDIGDRPEALAWLDTINEAVAA